MATNLRPLAFKLRWQHNPGADGILYAEVPVSVLQVPVTTADHIQGDQQAPVTLVEYGDYECPVSHRQSRVEAFR